MEIISHAESIGLKMVAITDHGSASGSKLCPRLFDRFINPLENITLVKGIEGAVHTKFHVVKDMICNGDENRAVKTAGPIAQALTQLF
jgi:predicted metal-dependent phosphoesterase TrpH